VADGVTGWNEYGFSSSDFSTELMENCRKEIDIFLNKYKKIEKSRKNQNKLKRNGSYISMENLDTNEDPNNEGSP
jgi:hypothetical protein